MSFSSRYAVDSLMLLVQSIIATQAAYEFKPAYTRGMPLHATLLSKNFIDFYQQGLRSPYMLVCWLELSFGGCLQM